ncbi:hypothetical protein GR160_10505 [Flavobacterium sp. Sd200]|uniref:hypothetical protein n=1 Tax=Flavobacterium sp. Sd200 TaxID=2692211 RepID=UPI00136ACCE2|nr:hypothetical protein [Flavobacterium sp. Sd200]MXN91656.1 hypothetical protein [Flavobacterium sp. Sd200]
MHLKIAAKPFSLSGKKLIFVDDKELYSAITDSIAGQECVKLIDKKDNIVLSVIIRELTLLQDSYKVRFLNRENIPIHFNRIERWKPHYKANYHDNTYTVKENEYNIYIISKNGTEIGRYAKHQSTFLSNEDIFIIDDNIADLELVVSLCLIIHEKESDRRNPD